MARPAAKFEVYRSGKAWRWRCRARNGKIVFVGESHPTKAKAERAMLRSAELAQAAATHHRERFEVEVTVPAIAPSDQMKAIIYGSPKEAPGVPLP